MQKIPRRGFLGIGSAIAAGLIPQKVRTEPASQCVCSSASLDPRAYGIVGDGLTDDTDAVRRYIAACETAGSPARFGRHVVLISGPITSRIPIIFDDVGYGSLGDPGFHVTGVDYTALTFTGSINDLAVTVYGHGVVTFRPDGSILNDSRPRVNGIAFGTPDGRVPFSASVVRSVRLFRLAGFGIKKTSVWDTSFLGISIEECGTATSPAYVVAAPAGTTCNQMNIVRLQVERSVGCAIYIHPLTLSSIYGHIHSEQAHALPQHTTWEIGGDVHYASVRLQSKNPEIATAVVRGHQCLIDLYRTEGGFPTGVDASGGHVQFNAPSAILAPTPNQSGQVTVMGGSIAARNIGAGWTFSGCVLSELTVGFMPRNLSSNFTDCTIERLAPMPGQTLASVVFRGCKIAGTTVGQDCRLADVSFLSGSVFMPTGGVARFGDQKVTLDQTSKILGSVVLDGTRFDWAGTVEGDVSQSTPENRHALAHTTAVATGRVTGWGPPKSNPSMPRLPNGIYCKNFSDSVVDRRRNWSVFGWYYAGEWIEDRQGYLVRPISAD